MTSETIKENVRLLLASVEQIASRLKRNPPKVLAAAKTKSPDEIAAAVEAGISVVGENYAQELEQKARAITQSRPDLIERITWHFIGGIQTNKLKKILPAADVIQTIDRLELAQLIEKQCLKLNRKVLGLIEVNIGEEANKNGILPEQLLALCRELAHLKLLSIRGLMVIPPANEDPRPHFARTRTLLEQVNRASIFNHPLEELSMGMSEDYEIAIEEGSTLIRVGTRLFGARSPKSG